MSADKEEKRTAGVGLRLYPSMKQALEKAAKNDKRTMAAMAEIIIGDYLRTHGYLPK
jgi:hypothetical protein